MMYDLTLKMINRILALWMIFLKMKKKEVGLRECNKHRQCNHDVWF